MTELFIAVLEVGGKSVVMVLFFLFEIDDNILMLIELLINLFEISWNVSVIVC